ncbi:uncharacterized protein [Littorina saxatilis]|uniref:RNA helicase n=1 Tax=Littorina saxatilis TaxID=31220 RepID=A0AAN9BAS6_9CAEN
MSFPRRNTARTLSDGDELRQDLQENPNQPHRENKNDPETQARQRTRKPPHTVPARKKLAPQQTNVYVRIHDVIRDIRVLSDVLTAKVNMPGVELTPTETCIRHSDVFTFCTLTCNSKIMAKKLRNLILKDRTRFTPLIDCSFDDFLPAELHRQNTEKAKRELRRVIEREFDARSEQVVRAHNQKLIETQEKIDKAKEKLSDLYTAKNTLEEIAALEHKLEELQRQKREFNAALDGFRQKLDTLLQGDNYEKEGQALRKQLGVECCRLEKALPMYARRQEVVELVRQNPVSVLLAETGSGKSTQVVQYLLEAGLADRGAIVCTQPRKVAASSLATHVAQELATNVGKDVGYKVGSRAKTSPSTKVMYMTDHALLNECLTDPDLKAFSCVVVDEAHERSLFTDILLTMVKRCMARRPDLRVIITSATIDPQVFVRFFGNNCPVLRVSGRAFPVDVVWQDSVSEEENDFGNYTEAAVNKAVEIHEKEPPGDILVFLTSAVEIQRCCDTFQQRMADRTDFKCLQLHGQLQADEQQKVFEPLERNKRKIVFATNCAETSITIDGIKYVVDTGVAKEMRYDPKRNLRSLNVTVISQSSAEQRKGRAGRTAPGKCYRLYSQHSFQAMDVISLPEILKTHLGHALLKLAELGVTPDMYDFVQSPSQEAIDAALKTLHQLGAMQENVITDKGRWIARLPFDPKLGLMTLHGRDCGLLFDAIVLAALVSAGSGLFYRGVTEAEHANLDKAKLTFSHNGGDSLTSLEVFKAWQGVEEKQKNKWCVENSINVKVIRGVRDTVNDVCKLLKNDLELQVTHKLSEDTGTLDALKKMLFICNAQNLCHFLGREKAGYFAAQASKRVFFHPSSALCSLGSYPEWVVFDQLLQTSRDFITGITPVDDSLVRQLKKEHFGFDAEEVRKKTLQNVFTQAAGSHAFFAVVGPRFTNIKELQETIASAESSSVIVLEASRETGEVKVFSTDMTDSVKTLENKLRQTIDTAVKDLQREVQEVSVGSEQSGVRVLLGQGAQITDILMPHETRKVFISSPSNDLTEEAIKQKFQAYGEISYCRKFQGGKNWGCVVFRTTAEAAAAVKGSKDDDHDVAELEHRRLTKYNAEFKARLSWNRRRAKGFGFVAVSPAYISKCLAISNVYIGGNLVRVKINKKDENSLYLTQLPAEVTEDLIKRTVLHTIGESEDAPDIVESVSVPRQTLGRTDKQELKRFEDQIKAKIERHLTASRVTVTVFSPKTEKTAMFLGEARFSDPIEGLEACRALRVDFTLGGAKVEVEPIISATLRVPQPVYDVCKTELDDLIARQLADMDVEVTVKELAGNNRLICLKADDMSDLVQARSFLSDVIRGDVLECKDIPALGNLLTSAGRQMLKEAEKETSAYVSVDNRLRTVSIHGSPQACTKVSLKINSYLNDTILGTGEEIMLRGDGRSPGLLKTLHVKHGEDLDGLRQATGLLSIDVDYRRHKLKLRGPPGSIEKAKQVVEESDQALKASSTRSADQEDDSIDCAACFCPIDKGDLYRLEVCAHALCKGCIVRQVSIAIKDHIFPVTCCQDGCDLPLAWRDFYTLSRLGHIKIPALATSALSHFVLANRDKARFCTTPDCPMVYRVTSESSADVFLCPECKSRTCTACHQQAHDGMSCSMLRSCKEPGEGIEDWVKKDPKNRRGCPGCKSPIEKISGCNKMHCTACGAVFCWVCTKKFPTEKQCYDHLARDHNGIFGQEFVLHYQ